MVIRKAVIEDWKQISSLLDQLEYSNTESFIKEKLEVLFRDPNGIAIQEEPMPIGFIRDKGILNHRNTLSKC
ncbi:hypothetical protein [Rummeliibacillus sp. TYF-LIM-RU47]|uniref:hypothetical protein n=1 Tax=Rummeliibacillus sp. TYF-LIM-RU47 TaxID=2608406 RepID=UPI0016800C08|nr:hypothetical protein [Rummeliibacillus sp. TYF-LIM-RU47]